MIPLLEVAAKMGKQDRVFHGVSTTNEHRWWDPVRARTVRAGVEHFTRHDLRRTCASGVTRLGYGRFVAGKILGHAEPKATATWIMTGTST